MSYRIIPGTGQSLAVGNNQVSGAVVGTGDGTTTTFSGTLANIPVVASTVSFTAGSVTGTDNGSGVISGTGVSGTINYTTGAWSLTYTTAPASAANITASYTYLKRATPFGTQTQYVRVASTAACHIDIGATPVASSSSAYIAPNVRGEVFRVTPGSTLSVIQDGSSTGNLSVVELCL